MRFLMPIILSMFIFSSSAFASQNISEDPTFIYAMSNSAIIFNQSGGPRTDLPSCASGKPDRWAFDAISAAGKDQLSILLIAKALHKSVQVTEPTTAPHGATWKLSTT